MSGYRIVCAKVSMDFPCQSALGLIGIGAYWWPFDLWLLGCHPSISSTAFEHSFVTSSTSSMLQFSSTSIPGLKSDSLDSLSLVLYFRTIFGSTIPRTVSASVMFRISGFISNYPSSSTFDRCRRRDRPLAAHRRQFVCALIINFLVACSWLQLFLQWFNLLSGFFKQAKTLFSPSSNMSFIRGISKSSSDSCGCGSSCSSIGPYVLFHIFLSVLCRARRFLFSYAQAYTATLQ